MQYWMQCIEGEVMMTTWYSLWWWWYVPFSVLLPSTLMTITTHTHSTFFTYLLCHLPPACPCLSQCHLPPSFLLRVHLAARTHFALVGTILFVVNLLIDLGVYGGLPLLLSLYIYAYLSVYIYTYHASSAYIYSARMHSALSIYIPATAALYTSLLDYMPSVLVYFLPPYATTSIPRREGEIPQWGNEFPFTGNSYLMIQFIRYVFPTYY